MSMELNKESVEQAGGDERAADAKPCATRCPDCGEHDLMPGDLCACGYETDPATGYACSECDGSGEGCVGEVCRECDGSGWFVTPDQARAALAEVERLRESKGDPVGSLEKCMKVMYERDEHAKRLEVALARVAEMEKELAMARDAAAKGDAARHAAGGMEMEIQELREKVTELRKELRSRWTYASTQATNCAGCGEHKHTPLRVDWMGGYVCLTCIDKKLEELHDAQAQHSVPEISGIGRDAEHPRAVVLYLRNEPSDEDMRAIQNFLRAMPAAAPAQAQHSGPDGAADLCRFLAKLYCELDGLRYSTAKLPAEQIADALIFKWPVLQGARNQLNIKRISEQPYDESKLHSAIAAMLAAAPSEKRSCEYAGCCNTAHPGTSLCIAHHSKKAQERLLAAAPAQGGE